MVDIKIKIRIDGIAPTLMHNNQAVNPLNKYSKMMKAITGKRKKSDEDFQELSLIEWEAGLYYDNTIGVYIPSSNVEAMLRDAAKKLKLGTAIKQSVMVFPTEIPLIYNGVRKLDEMKKVILSGEKPNGEDFIDIRSVGVNNKSIMRARPRFNKWAIEFEIVADDTVFNVDDIVRILAVAGDKIGLSDYRPKYGRFEFKVMT